MDIKHLFEVRIAIYIGQFILGVAPCLLSVHLHTNACNMQVYEMISIVLDSLCYLL